MKKALLSFFVVSSITARAQKIDSIYVNLYTDSLKKGTYNYINIDGLLSNGHYLPLDTTHLTFSASAGKFLGNSLWIDRDFAGENVTLTVVLKSDPTISKTFTIFIKKKNDDEPLKTVDEIINSPKKPRRNN